MARPEIAALGKRAAAAAVNADGAPRRSAWRLALAALSASAAVAAAGPSAAPAAPVTSRIAYTRLYAGPDGVSHFAAAQLVLASVPGAPGLAGALPVNILGDVKGVAFARLAAGATEDWHVSPQRLLMVCVQGTVEITAADGQKRLLAPGQFMLIEDATGKGHITRVVGATDHVALAMTVPPGWPQAPP
jgi:hypothetical protein